MSMPYTIYRCTRCDYRATGMATWGRFSYRVGDRLVDLERALGWCRDCADLRAVEVLPNHESDAALASHLAALDTQLRELRDSQHWLLRLLRLPLGLPPEHDRVAREREDVASWLKQERTRRTVLAGRRSGPRCLDCGSERCMVVPRNAPDREGRTAGDAGFTHPGCGGEMVMEPSSMRLNLRLSHRVYDAEGRVLSVEEHI